MWKPNVTVAAVVQRDGKFLLVEERTRDGVRLNQPAGHLEAGESIMTAVRREMLEETAYDFSPEQVIGVYRWTKPNDQTTYLRFAFSGSLGEHHADRTLDAGIIRTVWLSHEEILASVARHRSPLVVRCIADFMSGRRYGTELLVDFPG